MVNAPITKDMSALCSEMTVGAGPARAADEFALPDPRHLSRVVEKVQDAEQALCLEEVRDGFLEIDPATLQRTEGERRRMKMSEKTE